MGWLEDYKKKAYELHKAGKIAMVSNGESHSAYKEKGDTKIHVRYVCPKCGSKEEVYEELKFPYKLKCPKCREMVWKSKIQKKRGRKKEE